MPPAPSRNGHAKNGHVKSPSLLSQETLDRINKWFKPAGPPPAGRVRLVLDRLTGVRRDGAGWSAHCPAHPDRTPSLGVAAADDGKVLLHCHAGCDTGDVLAALRLAWPDLMPGGPAAVYDYTDESGALLFQVVRLDPKGFRQRRPDGAGGWSWSVKDVRRVLYRLPALLRANLNDLVFVVEGEKDADRLSALGLVAVCNAGGAGKWRAEYAEAFRGRGLRVVVLADNDEAGRRHAEQVAGSLAGVVASAAVLRLPGLPDKGDVSDWLAAGGTKAGLLALADGAALCLPPDPADNEPTEPDGDAAPGSLGSVGSVCVGSGGAEPPPPFPVHVFPKSAADYATAVAKSLPCAVDFVGGFMFVALAALVGYKHCLRVSPTWVERAVVWLLLVARSGSRKTPALGAAFGPLRAIQKRLTTQYTVELKAWSALPPTERAKLPRPKLRQVLTTSFTLEALHGLLASSPDVCVLADEGVGPLLGLGQYKSGKGDDRQQLLSVWSSQDVIVNRKGAEPLVISDPVVNFAGGVQPEVMGRVAGTEGEDGLLARFVFCCPPDTPAGDWSDADPADPAAYHRLCEAVWKLKPSADPLTLGPGAKEAWKTWVNAHRREERPDHLDPFWNKCEGYCLRFALVLFVARRAAGETDGVEIDAKSLGGAVELVTYFKGHARAAYELANTRGDGGRLGKALRWIRKQGGEVTARLMRLNGVAGVKSAQEAKELLQDLADHGHGTVTAGHRDSLVFRLAGTATRHPEPIEPNGPAGAGP